MLVVALCLTHAGQPLSICCFEGKVALGRVASELFRAIHTWESIDACRESPGTREALGSVVD